MSCIPASHSLNTILSKVESQLEENPLQRRGSKAFQIFPETNLNEESKSSSYSEDFLYRRERLPSIVVEPIENSDLESGELYWPPRCLLTNNVEVEGKEDTIADHKESSMDAEQQGKMTIEESSLTRKCSIGPSQSPLSFSRLTPPASPTPLEAVPPSLRS